MISKTSHKILETNTRKKRIEQRHELSIEVKNPSKYGHVNWSWN